MEIYIFRAWLPPAGKLKLDDAFGRIDEENRLERLEEKARRKKERDRWFLGHKKRIEDIKKKD